jgi:small subunit ribosomal protein S8
MSQSDPIADFLTIIRNGVHARKATISAPHSRMKADICRILAQEGFIEGWEVTEAATHGGFQAKFLRVTLRYADDLRRITPLNQLERISRPGRRVYVSRQEMPRVRGGYGISILSTSRGVLSDKEARQHHVGGELLLKVW